jgi:hypothetical protein
MAYASSDAVGTTHTTNATRRVTTETKSAFKTTEMIAYVGAVVAVIITALAVGQGSNGGPDPFSALDAIRYISYLTIGYMLARGLAKSGSRDPYDEHDDGRRS